MGKSTHICRIDEETAPFGAISKVHFTLFGAKNRLISDRKPAFRGYS